MSNYVDAIEYFKKSYLFFTKSDDNVSAAYALCNIGEIYYDSGDINKSLEYMKDAVEHMNKLDDKRHLAIQLQELGDIYKKMQQPDLAGNCYKESLDLLKTFGNQRDILNIEKKLIILNVPL